MESFKVYSMKRIVIYILSIFLFCLCNTKTPQKQSEKSGGTLRLAMYSNNFKDYIFPPAIDNDFDKSIASISNTSLFKINPFSLEIEDAICNEWEVDNTGLVYTFHLDSTAQFQRDKCFGHAQTRTLTAYDVKYTFHLLANPRYSIANFTNTVYHIKGAKDYFSMTDEQRDTSRIEGIKVLNDYTLQITLDKPSPHFIQNLAHPAAAILPHEAIEKYGKASTIGIGPFQYENDTTEIRFTKCNLYFGKDAEGNALPYLDTVIIQKVSSFDETVDLFANNQIDALLLVPSEQIAAIVKQFPSDLDYEISESNNTRGTGKMYNIIRPYVKGLYTNKLNILELDQVSVK